MKPVPPEKGEVADAQAADARAVAGAAFRKDAGNTIERRVLIEGLSET